MKKFLVIILGLSIILSLTGCGSNSVKSPEKTISVLTPYLSSVTTNEMVEKLKTMATEKGWKVNVVDTKGDFAQLASRMEDVISTKTSAIILVSTDPNQVKTQIEKAAEKKIPVFGCDSGYITGMAMNATSDNTVMSQMISNYLLKKLNNKGNLIVLTYRAHPGVLKRSLELDKLLKNNPGIKVVTEQQVQVPGPIENSRKQMESLLLANKQPGAITAVWCGWDEPAIGVSQAIVAAGRKDIIVTGIDGTSQAVDMINSGSPLVATVKQNFTGMAQIVINQMDLVFQGKTVEKTEMYAPALLISK